MGVTVWECATGLWLEEALDRNELALGFSAGLGAQRLSLWELHRLSGDALARVAADGR